MQATGNNQNLSHSLSIRLTADGFSFYDYTPPHPDSLTRESYLYGGEGAPVDVLRQALAQSAMIQNAGPAIVRGLVAGPSIQVPLAYFRKEEVNSLYRLTYAQEKKVRTYYNLLPHLNIAQVFTIDLEIEQALSRRFPDIKLYHNHTMLLEKMWMLTPQEEQRFYVCFHENEFFVFCFREQRLSYANTFPADLTENAVYFILSVWKDLGLDVQNEVCILMGNHAIKNGTARSLSRYLRRVQNAVPADIYRRSLLTHIPDIPFDLLSLLVHVI
ncbi:MAG: DUF3822 family protein [Paraprevotella sp.]|nr:DUF3822 family protein [Paraprevotella sp.]